MPQVLYLTFCWNDKLLDSSSIYIGAILIELLQMKRPPDNSLNLNLPKSVIENPIMA